MVVVKAAAAATEALVVVAVVVPVEVVVVVAKVIIVVAVSLHSVIFLTVSDAKEEQRNINGPITIKRNNNNYVYSIKYVDIDI